MLVPLLTPGGPPCGAGHVGLCDLELPSVLAMSSSVTLRCEYLFPCSDSRSPLVRPDLVSITEDALGHPHWNCAHMPFFSPRSSSEGHAWAVCTGESPRGADTGGLQGDLSLPWRSTLRAGPGCLVHTTGLLPRLSGLRGHSGRATGPEPSPVQKGSYWGGLG